METNNITFAICIVFAIVIGINGTLIAWARNTKNTQNIRLWQKAVKQARNPWQSENQDLQELSQLVSQIKEQPSKNPPEEFSP